MITVPRGKLQQNYNLVYDALETSRLEESVNKLNENDGIMVVRIKTIKQFDNVVQDLREIEGTVGKTTCTDGLLFVDHDDGICLGLRATAFGSFSRARSAPRNAPARRTGACNIITNILLRGYG